MDDKSEWEDIDEIEESEETFGPEEPCVDNDPKHYARETTEVDVSEYNSASAAGVAICEYAAASTELSTLKPVSLLELSVQVTSI